MAREIGNDCGHGSTSYGLLHPPEQLAHGRDAADDEYIGIEPELKEPGSIGQAELLRLADKLQIKDGLPLAGDELSGKAQGKAKGRPCLSLFVSKHLVQNASRSSEQHKGIGFVHPLRECRTLSEDRAFLQGGDLFFQGFEAGAYEAHMSLLFVLN